MGISRVKKHHYLSSGITLDTKEQKETFFILAKGYSTCRLGRAPVQQLIEEEEKGGVGAKCKQWRHGSTNEERQQKPQLVSSRQPFLQFQKL